MVELKNCDILHKMIIEGHEGVGSMVAVMVVRATLVSFIQNWSFIARMTANTSSGLPMTLPEKFSAARITSG